jgi:hypothetical protein
MRSRSEKSARIAHSKNSLFRPEKPSRIRTIACSDFWLDRARLVSASSEPIFEQLKQCRGAIWKTMNSYAHGGLHPLSRTLTGYPAQLAYNAVRNSNSVIALSAQLASILSGDPQNMEPVRRFHTDFADFLPVPLFRHELNTSTVRPDRKPVERSKGCASTGANELANKSGRINYRLRFF